MESPSRGHPLPPPPPLATPVPPSHLQLVPARTLLQGLTKSTTQRQQAPLLCAQIADYFQAVTHHTLTVSFSSFFFIPFLIFMYTVIKSTAPVLSNHVNGYSSESSSYSSKEGIVQLTDIQLSSMNPPSTPSKQQQQQQRRPSRHGPPPKAPPKTTRARRKNYLLNLNKICPGTLEELFTNVTFLKRLFPYISPLDRCTFSQVSVF